MSPSNRTAYGAVIDGQEILWSSGYQESVQVNLLRLNPADSAYRTIPVDFHSYGIGFDRNNHLFVTGHQEARLTRWNVLTGMQDWSLTLGGNSRGVAVTDDGVVWMVSSTQGAVYRVSNGTKWIALQKKVEVRRTPARITASLLSFAKPRLHVS